MENRFTNALLILISFLYFQNEEQPRMGQVRITKYKNSTALLVVQLITYTISRYVIWHRFLTKDLYISFLLL
jgi:hypothetical protein